ncbi:hypothetical protein D9611_008703 [Ephemerocybe angulata]|uniref:NAD(P)-binding protein n=1 Tax=Ephemerocybe angulata TaxID=980116 RepID=A0A8H5CCK1_9AGAR|nr:hypothetical protein D9611_008703 [Tulosesus angulatus]
MSAATTYKPNTLFDLSGRVAIVTGGGTGIGLKIASGFAAAGAKVYITGRRLEVLKKTASEWDRKIGGEIIPLQMDVTDKKSIIAARDLVKEKEGKIHILVNNAGQVGPVSNFFNKTDSPEHKDVETLGQALFDNEDMDGWKNLYQINVAALFFVTTAFLGLLAKGSEDVKDFWSNVINITSISGITSLAQEHFCYNSSKAAATHITKMLATEFALKGIAVRVNSIAPGVFESEMTYGTINGEEVDKIGKGIRPVPAKRPGSAEEMAGTALYLASRAGGYTNGQEIVVDGGYLATNP